MTQKFQLRQIRQRRCMAATGQAISRRDWVPQREMGTGRQGPWAGWSSALWWCLLRELE